MLFHGVLGFVVMCGVITCADEVSLPPMLQSPLTVCGRPGAGPPPP